MSINWSSEQTQYHVISTLFCLPCGKHHRTEIGLSEDLILIVQEDGTLHELRDEFPDIYEVLESDSFMSWTLQEFVLEHENHDIRYFNTAVYDMSKLVEARVAHFQKMIKNYEQFRKVLQKLEEIRVASVKSHS